METLKDLVAACRDTDGAVIETATRTAPYTYSDFVPNVWKSGNLLGHYGVHPGAEVTVLAGPKEATPAETTRRLDSADPIVAALGATMVGATVRLSATEPVTSRVLVLPAGWTENYEVEPQCSLVAYGGPPTAPEIVHFEEEMWSENPIEPPERVAPEDVALADETGSYSHGELLAAATGFVNERGLDDGDRLALDAPLVEPGSLVAVLAVLVANGTLLLPTAESEPVDATLTVSENPVENGGRIAADQLTQRLRDTRRA